MPYCVNCGVKLVEGNDKCPLCGVPVILPEELKKEESKKPLFPKNEGKKVEQERALSKSAKTSLEIITSLMVIAEVCCFIALFPDPSCYIAMSSVLLGYLMFLTAIIPYKRTYVSVATKEIILVSILLIAIDFFADWTLKWSFYPIIFLVLAWIGGVLTVFLKKKPTLSFIFGAIDLLAFFPIVDYLSGWEMWSINVAYPIIGFAAVLILLIIFRSRNKKLIALNLSDLILLGAATVCFTVAFGDLAAHHFDYITWSGSLWIIGSFIFVFEILRTTSKKFRNFFTADNS